MDPNFCEFFRSRVPCLLDPVVCLGDAGTHNRHTINGCVCSRAILFACSCKGRKRKNIGHAFVNLVLLDVVVGNDVDL